MLGQAQGSSFYYVMGDSSFVSLDTTMCGLQVPQNFDESVFITSGLNYEYKGLGFYEVYGTEAAIISLGLQGVELMPTYVNEGKNMYLTGKVIARFHEWVSNAERDALILSLGLSPYIDRAEFQAYSSPNPIESCQLLYESGKVRYAAPDQIAFIELSGHVPNDEYFGNQWNLLNTGVNFNDGTLGILGADIHVSEAWELTTGSEDVTVAVIENTSIADSQAISDDPAHGHSTHPDLPGSRCTVTGNFSFQDDYFRGHSMRYFASIVLCTAFALSGAGQYNYFNTVDGVEGDDASEVAFNCEYLDSSFYIWGGESLLVTNRTYFENTM